MSEFATHLPAKIVDGKPATSVEVCPRDKSTLVNPHDRPWSGVNLARERTHSASDRLRTFSLCSEEAPFSTWTPASKFKGSSHSGPVMSIGHRQGGGDATEKSDKAIRPHDEGGSVSSRYAEMDADALDRRAKLMAAIDADSSQALGLFEEFFRLEVVGLDSAPQRYSLPVSYTVDQVKEYIFSKEPTLLGKSPAIHHLGLSDDNRLLISFVKFVRSHPDLLRTWENGDVLQVRVFSAATRPFDGPRYRDRSDTLRFLDSEAMVTKRGGLAGRRGRGRGRGRGAGRGRGRGGLGADAAVPPSHRSRQARGLISPRKAEPSPRARDQQGLRQGLSALSLLRGPSQPPNHRSRKAVGLGSPRKFPGTLPGARAERSGTRPTSDIVSRQTNTEAELPGFSATRSEELVRSASALHREGVAAPSPPTKEFVTPPDILGLRASGISTLPTSFAKEDASRTSVLDIFAEPSEVKGDTSIVEVSAETVDTRHGVCVVPGYVIEEPCEDDAAGSMEEMVLQDTERYVTYYNNFFYSKEHAIYMGEHPKKGPMIVFILLEQVTDVESLKSFFMKVQQEKTKGEADSKSGLLRVYRALIWTQHGEEDIFVRYYGKNAKTAKKRTDALLKVLKEQCELVRDVSLRVVDDPKVPSKLLELEFKQVVVNYKFGVLYAKEGQVAEEDMFSNEAGSPAFKEFLGVLGDTIALKGWDKYRGGLNTNDDATGKESVYINHRSFGVMYHVSTMLPFSKTNRQQLHRKRHIGNDIVVVVFIDGETSFNPEVVVSEFNHVFFVVRPVYDEDRTLHFSLNVVWKEGVKPCMPRMPIDVLFIPGPDFREFILTKLINAERCAYHAPNFAQKIRRTKKMLLLDLYSDYGGKK